MDIQHSVRLFRSLIINHSFIEVANEGMCRPIRSLTEGRGYDARNHRLAVFGGAGGQHACSIARNLNINSVVVHKYSSVLSAYGMALAEIVHEGLEPISEVYCAEALSKIRKRLDALQGKVQKELKEEGFDESSLRYERYLNMRYQGTDTSMMIMEPENGDFEQYFLANHLREFTFTVPGRPILVDDLRVRGVANDGTSIQNVHFVGQLRAAKKHSRDANITDAENTATVYFEETGWVQSPVYMLDKLSSGVAVAVSTGHGFKVLKSISTDMRSNIQGPAIILDKTQTIVVVPGATSIILDQHVVIDVGVPAPKEVSADAINPVQLSVFGHRFMSIAEQMGRTLQKTSVSLNIKERLDFSCAIFGPDGGLVANAPHVPVHLGSMQNAVKYQHEVNLGKLKPGDVLVTNHPGMHFIPNFQQTIYDSN